MSAAAARRGAQLRLVSLLAPPLVAAAMFAVWAQPWVTLTLDDGLRITATGMRTAAVLPAIAVAALALTSALALAAPRIRPLLGLLLGVLGGLACAVSLTSLVDPVATAASEVTALTGVDGDRSVRALIESADVTAWPTIAAVLGGVMAIVGLAIAATAQRWPARGERFERPAGGAQDTSAQGTTDATGGEGTDPTHESIGAWDALSDGHDPTAR